MSKRKRFLLIVTVLALALVGVSALAACEDDEPAATYTVTLRSGFDDAVITETVEEGASFTLPENTFVRPGYEFIGWTREGSTFLLAPGASSPIYADTVYEANWRLVEEPGPVTYTVTLSDGYASGTTSVTVAADTMYTLPESPFQRTDYTFTGWNVSGETLPAGESVLITGDITISAVWEPVPKYTVTLLSGENGETISVSSPMIVGSTYTLPTCSWHNPGSDFAGWYYEGDILVPGSAVIVTSDITIYALWTEQEEPVPPVEYVTITVSGGDAGGQYIAQVEKGTEYTLPSNTFTYTGYVFVNWEIDGTSYEPGDTVTAEDDLTVTAVWRALEQYTVIYDWGYEGGANMSVTATEGVSFTLLSAPVRPGYAFAGWEYGGDIYEAGAVFTASESVTFTAQWTATTKYTVTFVSDGATFETIEQTLDGFIEVPEAPVKEGYAFTGWTSGDVTLQAGQNYQVSGDMTFTAVWERISFEVTFILYGNVETEPQVVYYGETPVPPTVEEEITVSAYEIAVFQGWSPAVGAVYEDTTYTAQYTLETRMYPVTLSDTEYIDYLTPEGTPISDPAVEFGAEFKFKIAAKNLGVDITSAVVYGNGEALTAAEDGTYTLPFDSESLGSVSVEGYTVTEYFIKSEVSPIVDTVITVNGSVYDGGALSYGDSVTFTLTGSEYHAEGVSPKLRINDRYVTLTSGENGAYTYALEVSSNLYVSVEAGGEKVIQITYVDILDNEYTFDWHYSMGPVGNLSYLYDFDTNAVFAKDNIQYMLAFANTADGAMRIYSCTADKEERIMDRTSLTALAKAMASDGRIYPDPSEDNIYYIAYGEYFDWGQSIYFYLPQDSSAFMWRSKTAQSEDWSEWSTGEKTGTTDIYKLSVVAPNTTFRMGTLLQVAFKSSSDNLNMINEATGVVVSPATTDIEYGGATDTYYVYEIEATNSGSQYYINKRDNDVEIDITFSLSDNIEVYIGSEANYGGSSITGSDGRNKIVNFTTFAEPGTEVILRLGFMENIYPGFRDYVVASEGGRFSYELSEDIQMFNLINGEISDLLIGAEYYELFMPPNKWNLFISFVVDSDLEISIDTTVDFPVNTIQLPLVYNAGYDWHIGDDENSMEKVEVTESSSTATQWAVGQILEIRPREGQPTFDIIGDVDFVIFNLSRYIVTNLVEEGYAELISADEDSIKFKLLKVDIRIDATISTNVSVPLGVQGFIQGAAQVVHESELCASSVAANEITLISAPDVSAATSGEWTLTVEVPEGRTPVLWLDRMDSDGYVAYAMTEEETETAGKRRFTFTANGILNSAYWYLDISTDVYEITAHYAGYTTAVMLPHGTELTATDLLPQYVVADIGEGMCYYPITGWLDAPENGSLVLVVTSAMDIYAELGAGEPCTVVFYPDGGEAAYYTDIAAALSALDGSSEGTLDILYVEGAAQTLDGNVEYTVPAGVTLRLPYALDGYDRKLAELSDAPSRFYADPAGGYNALVIGENTTLTVYGTLSVGGIVGYPSTYNTANPVYQGHTSAAHALLTLDGTLNIASGGTLEVNGYVVGSGQLNVLSGGTSKLPFIVKDYRGGTNTTNIFYEGYAPFNIYEMPNIMTNYTIHYGANEIAYAMLYASSNYQESEVVAIGAEGIIRVDEGGYVVKKTNKIDNPRANAGNGEPAFEFRTALDIYGGGTDGVLSLKISVITVTTAGKYLAIPYTYSSITLHDGDYYLYNMYKIMPGASLNVASSANLTIFNDFVDGVRTTGALAVYDLADDHVGNYVENAPSVPGALKYPTEPNADGVDYGVFSVSGTLTVRGRLAGTVAAGAAGAEIRVYSSADFLSIETGEATYFKDDIFKETYNYSETAKVMTSSGLTDIVSNTVYTSTADGDVFLWEN